MASIFDCQLYVARAQSLAAVMVVVVHIYKPTVRVRVMIIIVQSNLMVA